VSVFEHQGELSGTRDTIRLLADASDQEWEVVLRHTRHRRFGPGETVAEVGATEQSLYLVLEGEMEVLVPHGRRGHNRRVALIGAGSVLGELSFFDGAPRSALVRALTPVLLAELTPADFELLADASPSLARRLLFDLGRNLAQRLRAVARASDTLAGTN